VGIVSDRGPPQKRRITFTRPEGLVRQAHLLRSCSGAILRGAGVPPGILPHCVCGSRAMRIQLANRAVHGVAQSHGSWVHEVGIHPIEDVPVAYPGFWIGKSE
jgi:hypothetical protein